jgi:hypothetical protein
MNRPGCCGRCNQEKEYHRKFDSLQEVLSFLEEHAKYEAEVQSGKDGEAFFPWKLHAESLVKTVEPIDLYGADCEWAVDLIKEATSCSS